MRKIISILDIEPPINTKPDQLASNIVEHFIEWEYSLFMDPGEKAKELLFQQIVSILKNMKSQKELESLGIFCRASGKIFQQPVQLNCDSAHIVNFETLNSDCKDIACPLCKQTVTEINMARGVMDHMYSVVADIIRTSGVRGILPYIACQINMGSIQSLFNRHDDHPINLLSLVARNLAELAIRQDNLLLLTRLLNQDHLKKLIITSSRLLYIAALNPPSSQILNRLIQHGADINRNDEDKGPHFTTQHLKIQAKPFNNC